MPNPLNVPITPPRVVFIDPRTGNVSREWYMFFLSLFQLTGGSGISLDDVQKGPPPVTIDEINHTINKATADTAPSQGALLAQIAELQKQVDGINSNAAAPQLGTMAPMNKEFMDYIGWNQNAGITPTAGQTTWDAADGTLAVGTSYDDVIFNLGLQSAYRIKASSAISKGDLVMFTGAVGASGVIQGAPSGTGLSEGLYIMGVALMDIANNAFGYISNFGLVRGFNTTGSSVGETWNDGDILYYNPSYVGGMTNVRPTSPAEVVVVAAVLRAGAGGSGSIFVRVSFYPKLTELSNVYSPSPNNGDLIQYNTANLRWENIAASTVVAGSEGPPVTKTNDFNVAVGETYIINNKSGSTCTATLPTASSYSGRKLVFQNYQAQFLVSASSNVVPLGGGAAGTAILDDVAGANAMMISDGTNWVIMQYDSNDSLILE
jgi:hypothetical protein